MSTFDLLSQALEFIENCCRFGIGIVAFGIAGGPTESGQDHNRRHKQKDNRGTVSRNFQPDKLQGALAPRTIGKQGDNRHHTEG